MNDIDVVIVNFNAGGFLSRAVASVLASSRVNRVIVVDNASQDGSKEAIAAAALRNPRIVCLENTDNTGFAHACNQGIAATRAAYLFFLNPDCDVQDGAMDRLIDVLEQDPRTGMTGPLVLNADGTEQAGARRAVPTPWRSFVRAFGLARFRDRYPKLFYDFHLHEEPLPEIPVEVEAISGSSMMVKRTAVTEVGCLDEAYFLHCEDLDWCMRFRRAGWKILFVPEARVVHNQGVCSNARPLFVEWHKHRGMLRFYRKFFRHQYPGLILWLVGSGIWLRFGLISARIAARRGLQWLCP